MNWWQDNFHWSVQPALTREDAAWFQSENRRCACAASTAPLAGWTLTPPDCIQCPGAQLEGGHMGLLNTAMLTLTAQEGASQAEMAPTHVPDSGHLSRCQALGATIDNSSKAGPLPNRDGGQAATD